MHLKSIVRWIAISAFLSTAVLSNGFVVNGEELPVFGMDTVLVWETKIQNVTSEFVVRLASFRPNLLLEWENGPFQGTVMIPSRDILKAKGYVNKALFKDGMDTRTKNETAMWISQRIYQDLKEKKKAKCNIDRMSGRFTYEGNGKITVEVNEAPSQLPVIIVSDDRGAERWFLDREDNPLMVKYIRKNYDQTLVSVTTNRSNALRWLKGRKLQQLLAE